MRHRISDHVEHRRSPILTQTHHILIFGKTTRRYLRWFISSLSGKVLVSVSFWFVGNRKGFSNRENRSGVGLVVQSGSEPCVTNNPNDIVLHLLSTSLFRVSLFQNSIPTSIKYNRDATYIIWLQIYSLYRSRSVTDYHNYNPDLWLDRNHSGIRNDQVDIDRIIFRIFSKLNKSIAPYQRWGASTNLGIPICAMCSYWGQCVLVDPNNGCKLRPGPRTRQAVLISLSL